jgi:WASH complex subunit 7
LSSLVLAEKVLHGPGTKERRLIAHLALSTANQMRTFRDDEWASLSALLHKLDVMCDIQEKVAAACDCSFFYWHRVILPIYFANLYESKMDLNRLMVRN